MTGETSGIYTKVTVGDGEGLGLDPPADHRHQARPCPSHRRQLHHHRHPRPAEGRLRPAPPTRSPSRPARTVAGTGVHSGSYSQVIYSGRKLGWVITGYLRAVGRHRRRSYVLPMRVSTLYVDRQPSPSWPSRTRPRQTPSRPSRSATALRGTTSDGKRPRPVASPPSSGTAPSPGSTQRKPQSASARPASTSSRPTARRP